jgi:eukaryotic-like serine/threonine-protein kinase
LSEASAKAEAEDAQGRRGAARRVYEHNGTPAEDSGSFLLPGAQIGPHRVLDIVGTGSTGVVYRVRDKDRAEERALKLLAKKLAEHEELIARYRQEARVAGELRHPGLITVHGFGEHQGRPYIVMEYRDAPTLDRRLRPGALPPEEARAILAQLADALAVVHAHGVVHRDLKPKNILYDKDGRATIIDFGLARLVGSSLTRSGVIMGALGYCAPEQITMSHRVDHRADLFALGVLFYRLLTGQKPFPTDSMERFAEAVLHDEPKPPSALTALPPGYDEIARGLLAKDRDARTPSAGALLQALSRL